jgi:hypothetical protein
MEKKYQLVPISVENFIISNYGYIPSTLIIPLVTKEGFETLSSLEKIWSTDFYYDKNLYSYEGLIKYKDTDMFVY